ncbi:MAG: histidinol-phosphate aminotransferase family protein [Dehalococcoidia bacterium]|nr:MAG: histidinol-phosphate aminotransferase family protein [Dehalococcoidia bacterium]
MPPSPKPHIKDIKPAFHGGASFSRQASSFFIKEGVLDFSTCCNPYGPPKSISQALRNADAEHYPDPDCNKLANLLSQKEAVTPANLIIGSGSTELIRLAATAYSGPGDMVIIPYPTYGEYELASKIAHTQIVRYQIKEKNGFKLACGEFIAHAKLHNPAIIFLCNPNNPTGQYLGLHDIERILNSFPDTLVVLDEAYIAFTDGAWNSGHLLAKDNLLIVRSMTKDFAIAGLRLGYGMASETIITNLKKVRPPWNVNSAAQEAGLAALSSGDYTAQCADRIRVCKTYLTEKLAGMGYLCVPTLTNFFMFKTGNASQFQKQMLAKGILVRDCTSFGLPAYVRVAPQGVTK